MPFISRRPNGTLTNFCEVKQGCIGTIKLEMSHRQGCLTGRWSRPRPQPPAAGPRLGEWPAQRGGEQSPPLLWFPWPARPAVWGPRWWSSQWECGCRGLAPPAPGRPCGTQRRDDGGFPTWYSHNFSLSSFQRLSFESHCYSSLAVVQTALCYKGFKDQAWEWTVWSSCRMSLTFCRLNQQ